MNIKKILPAVAAGVFCGALIFSAVRSGFSAKGDRRVLYFHSFDTKALCTEIRRIEKVTGREKVSVFVDELLLGPMTYRYRYLFTPGTVAEFCFTKGKTLYVGLSEDALAVHDEVLPVEQGIELLKKNVKENFPRIDDVVVFIGNSEFSLEKSAESAEN